MALKVIEKINGRLKFLWRKNKFLTPLLKLLLWNALIQPHFDYASSAWYPNLQKKLWDKLHIFQNKSITFCLSLGNRSHIWIQEFKEINWLPVRARFEQNVTTHIFKLCDWFVDNKLSINFGDDKTKSILFSCKNRPRDDKLKISRGRTEVAQHKEINYLGCLFGEKCTGESMALKIIEK